MTLYDFILSGQRRHRVTRHIAFWVVWCLAFNVFFHFPIHVFKGWDLTGPGTKNYQDLGPVLFFFKSLIVNTFFAVVVPQILLVYTVIYGLLPNLFFEKKNLLVSLAVTVAVLIAFFYIAVGFKYTPVLFNNFLWPVHNSPSYRAMQRFVMVDQLTSLPIILGLALLIKLVKRWWMKQKETEQLAKEKIHAELQLLKAQIHPHFLFNTLNNIYFFTITGSPKASGMIRRLSGLLHYILNECDQPLVLVEKELRMIQDYIALEKLRYGDQILLSVDMPDECNGKLISPLLLIPFVENSFKHGASKMISDAFVNLHIAIDGEMLFFYIQNSRPDAIEPPGTKGNIGLKNVQKRLQLLYPEAHELITAPEPGKYSVFLKLKLEDAYTEMVNEKIKTHPASVLA